MTQPGAMPDDAAAESHARLHPCPCRAGVDRRHRRVAAVSGVLLSVFAGAGQAQTLQVAPFGGYRFGGDLYEAIIGAPLDIDGALCAGGAIDVFIDDGLSVTFIYTHQAASIEAPSTDDDPERVRLSIDHWHAGAAQEVGDGVVRPFFGAHLGLTRFGGAGDAEVRFSLGAGGGVKLMPTRHLGARFDGRAYVVFVDGAGTSACAGGCVVALDVSAAWQVEFTAGMVISF
jgi:hypothetical protein